MPEKYTVEQKIAIVIESFTSTNIAELCRRYGYPLYVTIDRRRGSLRVEAKPLENHLREMSTRRRSMI